jgi:hypothetical protein
VGGVVVALVGGLVVGGFVVGVALVVVWGWRVAVGFAVGGETLVGAGRDVVAPLSAAWSGTPGCVTEVALVDEDGGGCSDPTSFPSPPLEQPAPRLTAVSIPTVQRIRFMAYET